MTRGKTVRTSIAVVIGSLVFFSGCGQSGGGGGGPEGVVKSFLKSAQAKNYSKAITCYSPSIAEEPGAKEKLTGYLKSSMEQKGGIASFSVGEASIDGEKARVSYTVTYKDGAQDESKINCVKENGKWYLSLK